MSKVSKTSYRWVSKHVSINIYMFLHLCGWFVRYCQERSTYIWYFQASVLTWHLWSSGTLNVRQLPSTSKVSGCMPGAKSRHRPFQNLSNMGQSQKSCVCRLISVTLGLFILHFLNPGQFSALGSPWATSDLEKECQATLKPESKFCYWLPFQGLVLKEGHHCETTSEMNHVTRIMLWCQLTETLLTLAVV